MYYPHDHPVADTQSHKKLQAPEYDYYGFLLERLEAAQREARTWAALSFVFALISVFVTFLGWL